MRTGILQSLKRVVPTLFLALIAVGCASRLPEPSPPSTLAASPTAVNTAASPTEEPQVTPTAVSASPGVSTLPEGVLYQDDFKKVDSGWPALEFDNAYIGYHEPDFYHVEVHSPNDEALVAVPDMSFEDFTAEIEVFVVSDLTADTGDFRYGLLFRRSGRQFYAFTISPSTRKWFVLKSSPTGLEILKEGSHDAIQGLEATDTLRVDVRGDNFFFHINDQSVGLVSDPDYTSGEIGFYVQTFDSPQVHIHYDTLAIREVQAPELLCNVITEALNLRTGPSTRFRSLTALESGDTFEPLGRIPDGSWIQINVEALSQQGWVYYSPRFVSCSLPVADLPVIEP